MSSLPRAFTPDDGKKSNHANDYQRPNSWFRLYSEFADDPKVQIMNEALQRRLVMLFCSRCKGEKITDADRAFHWRISAEELAVTKAVFLEKGFIDEDWNLVNWNRRQFISDSSTERTRQYRRRLKQGETSRERDQSQRQIQSQKTETENNTPPPRKRAGPPWTRSDSRRAMTCATDTTAGERILFMHWTEEEWVEHEREYEELMAFVNRDRDPTESSAPEEFDVFALTEKLPN